MGLGIDFEHSYKIKGKHLGMASILTKLLQVGLWVVGNSGNNATLSQVLVSFYSVTQV